MVWSKGQHMPREDSSEADIAASYCHDIKIIDDAMQLGAFDQQMKPADETKRHPIRPAIFPGEGGGQTGDC